MFKKIKALLKLYKKFSPWMLGFLANQPTTGQFFYRDTNTGKVCLNVLISGADDQLRDRLHKILDDIGGEEQYLFH
jgi:hypothetical protein